MPKWVSRGFCEKCMKIHKKILPLPWYCSQSYNRFGKISLEGKAWGGRFLKQIVRAAHCALTLGCSHIRYLIMITTITTTIMIEVMKMIIIINGNIVCIIYLYIHISGGCTEHPFVSICPSIISDLGTNVHGRLFFPTCLGVTDHTCLIWAVLTDSDGGTDLIPSVSQKLLQEPAWAPLPRSLTFSTGTRRDGQIRDACRDFTHLLNMSSNPSQMLVA